MTFRRLMNYLGLIVSVLAIGISLVSGYIASRAFTPAAVEAQTYVRPSRGKPISLGTLAATGATSLTSSLYDWTAFSGAVITISRVTVDDDCPIPFVQVRNHVTANSTGTLSTEVNGTHAYIGIDPIADDIYYTAVTSPYVSFYITFVDQFNVATGTDISTGTCSYAFYVVPEAFPQEAVGSGGLSDERIVTVATTNTNVFLYSADTLSPKNTVTLQNRSTSVVRCSVLSARPMRSGVAGAILLAAGTAAADGTGGSVSLYNFVGSIWCNVAAGTAAVGMSAY